MMNPLHTKQIANELSITQKQVIAVAQLLSEDATVPFIARYRKEVTGSLDEVVIAAIRDRISQLEELDKRRAAILNSLEERKLLTDELKEKIEAAITLTELEDIYLPYRPKRRTKATVAKEKGLEPLSEMIFSQENFDIMTEAEKYIDAEKGVNTIEEALQGARDIMAEWVSENQEAREKMRDLYQKKGLFISRVVAGKEEEGIKYKDYYEWSEPISAAPSHRVLAMRRGENEGFLSLKAEPETEDAVNLLQSVFVKGNNDAASQVKLAIDDSYKRLLGPSMETETRVMSKEAADREAIAVFADNLRQLLLAAPLGEKRVLAIDPGFRTGCKVVCLDENGKLLKNDNIYPTQSEAMKKLAAEKLKKLVDEYKSEVIAIGNGTASRETETFVKGIDFGRDIPTIMVNESGASIYSASDVAREEFPDYDVTVRGSVSIGRRLMDPLAELVKIDAKSIGVGQYQHDVDQKALKDKLDDVVISCVNKVGVELNTASKELLTYVSGLGPKLAKSIIDYRNDKGAFKSREEVLKVPRLGNKAFEQAAGFLRIRDAKNPLDSSAVHPESYPIVYKMAEDLGCTVEELMHSDELRKKIDINKYVSDTVGLPTLSDIMDELAKPGRDPRQKFELFKFAEGIEKMEDLKPGMKLPGIVTNLTAFGAFVDIGVHQDGLVHISQITDRFIKNPAEVLKVAQKVDVTVVEIDLARKRIQLSMKEPGAKPAAKNTNSKVDPNAVKVTRQAKIEEKEDKLKMLLEKFKK
jgi:uncharacterized protein